MSTSWEIEQVRRAAIAPRFLQHHPVVLAFGGGAYVGGWAIAHFGWRSGRTGGKPALPDGMRSRIRAALRGQALRAAEVIARAGHQPRRVRAELNRMRREGQIRCQGIRGQYRYTLLA